MTEPDDGKDGSGTVSDAAEPVGPAPEETEITSADVDDEPQVPEEAELLSPDEAFAVAQLPDEDSPEAAPDSEPTAPPPSPSPAPLAARAAEPGVAAAGVWARWRWIVAGILILVLVMVYVVPNLSNLGDLSLGGGEAAPAVADPVTARLEALEASVRAASVQRVELRSGLVANRQQVDAAAATVAARLEALEASVRAASVQRVELRSGLVANRQQMDAAVAGAPSQAGADAKSNARLSRELAQAAARIAALEAAGAALDVPAPATTAAPAAVSFRSATTGIIAPGPAPAAPPEAVLATSAARALVVATGQLREQARTAQSFQTELEAVRAVSPGDAGVAAAVAELVPHAGAGVETEAELGRRFAAIAGPVVAADRAGQASGQGWLARLWDSIGAAVTIRRTGDVSGTGAEAWVASAELRLADGDLAGALADMRWLEGEARSAASGWIAAAGARVAVDAAASRLAQRAAFLAAETSTTSP
jgi:hypothetical protein